MLYEIWLDDFRFPIKQKELSVYEENDVSSVTIDGFGEISKTTNMKLRTFTIESFFMTLLNLYHHMQSHIQEI